MMDVESVLVDDQLSPHDAHVAIKAVYAQAVLQMLLTPSSHGRESSVTNSD